MTSRELRNRLLTALERSEDPLLDVLATIDTEEYFTAPAIKVRTTEGTFIIVVMDKRDIVADSRPSQGEDAQAREGKAI